MSSTTPSPLAHHAAALAQHGAVLFLEHTPLGLGHVVLTLLRYKCALVMLSSATMFVLGVGMAATGQPDGAAALPLGFALVVALLGLGAWVAYAIFGWLRRRWQAPPARVLELSRFGLRVSAQCDPTLIGAPLSDAFGRAVIPWTAWSDVTGDALNVGTLSFALYSEPGRVDLALTPSLAAEARDLARALAAEAHRPIG